MKNPRANLYVRFRSQTEKKLSSSELDTIMRWHNDIIYPMQRDALIHKIAFRLLYWIFFLILYLVAPSEGAFWLKVVIIIMGFYNFAHAFGNYVFFKNNFNDEVKKDASDAD